MPTDSTTSTRWAPSPRGEKARGLEPIVLGQCRHGVLPPAGANLSFGARVCPRGHCAMLVSVVTSPPKRRVRDGRSAAPGRRAVDPDGHGGDRACRQLRGGDRRDGRALAVPYVPDGDDRADPRPDVGHRDGGALADPVVGRGGAEPSVFGFHGALFRCAGVHAGGRGGGGAFYRADLGADLFRSFLRAAGRADPDLCGSGGAWGRASGAASRMRGR